jgi:hypothetical protein
MNLEGSEEEGQAKLCDAVSASNPGPSGGFVAAPPSPASAGSYARRLFAHTRRQGLMPRPGTAIHSGVQHDVGTGLR